jgi:hypothetical protein
LYQGIYRKIENHYHHGDRRYVCLMNTVIFTDYFLKQR